MSDRETASEISAQLPAEQRKQMSEAERAAELAYAEALFSGGDDKWIEIFEKVVKPVCKSCTKNGVAYAGIMKSRDIDDKTLFGMLYEEMVYKKKLKSFEGRCPLIYWMRMCAKGLILNYCKKYDNPVSEPVEKPFLVDEDIDKDNTDIWEVVEKSFSKLWRSNPMKAYVYLLKKYHNLPSKQIAVMLGLTDSNVDKIFQRAKEDMDDFLQEMGGSVK